MRNQSNIIHLDNRGVLRVAGPDAENFLQGLITQDVTKLGNKLLYSALLTPQGNMLHDFFIYRQGEGIFLDCEHARRNDLLHRLGLYRMRAKVSIEDVSSLWRVYAAAGYEADDNVLVFDDPRGDIAYQRLYTSAQEGVEAEETSSSYEDVCIDAGFPLGARTFIPERDIVADMNLDLLHTVAWDKGCYVGQEVTARVRFRGLVKKRLLIAQGGPFSCGDRILEGGHEIGEIRTVSTDGRKALAIVRLNALENRGGEVMDSHGRKVAFVKPPYLR